MTAELSQDEINKLLASSGKKSDVTLKKFLENGRKFNKQIVKWLVLDLLGDKKKGHGQWWGGESCLSFREFLSYETKELENGGYEVSAVCEMEYESSHIIYDENYEPILQKSHITLKLKPDLTLEGYDFK